MSDEAWANASLRTALQNMHDVATKPLHMEIGRRLTALNAELSATNERKAGLISELVKALDSLLREMTRDYSLPSYDVYQVTKGAVEAARSVLAQGRSATELARGEQPSPSAVEQPPQVGGYTCRKCRVWYAGPNGFHDCASPQSDKPL